MRVENFSTMNEDDWQMAYPLLPNHLNPAASWNGCLFDTHGPEGDFVRQHDENRVWTLLEDGDGNSLIASGYHGCNRLGNLVSTRPTPEGSYFEVPLKSSELIWNIMGLDEKITATVAKLYADWKQCRNRPTYSTFDLWAEAEESWGGRTYRQEIEEMIEAEFVAAFTSENGLTFAEDQGIYDFITDSHNDDFYGYGLFGATLETTCELYRNVMARQTGD